MFHFILHPQQKQDNVGRQFPNTRRHLGKTLNNPPKLPIRLKLKISIAHSQVEFATFPYRHFEFLSIHRRAQASFKARHAALSDATLFHHKDIFFYINWTYAGKKAPLWPNRRHYSWKRKDNKTLWLFQLIRTDTYSKLSSPHLTGQNSLKFSQSTDEGKIKAENYLL